MHSEQYNLIKAWYDMGLWDESRLGYALDRGKITQEEYDEIVTGNFSAEE